MLAIFASLAARADTSVGVLSGGEKQMLTICRTLMGDPVGTSVLGRAEAFRQMFTVCFASRAA